MPDIQSLFKDAWSNALAASSAGGASFVEDVLTQDFVLAYFTSGPWGRGGVLHAVGQALSILLPWTILIPVALWSSMGTYPPSSIRGAMRRSSASSRHDLKVIIPLSET